MKTGHNTLHSVCVLMQGYLVLLLKLLIIGYVRQTCTITHIMAAFWYRQSSAYTVRSFYYVHDFVCTCTEKTLLCCSAERHRGGWYLTNLLNSHDECKVTDGGPGFSGYSQNGTPECTCYVVYKS